MEASKKHHKPDISGVSEEIQNSIKSDLQAAPLNKGYHLLLADKRIGISVSDNEELAELGYSTIHLKDLMIEIVRHLLINGGTLVYGGNTNKEGFTYLFSDLSYQYREINEFKKVYFENYFAYPYYCLLTEEDEAHFLKCRMDIIKVPPPTGMTPDENIYLPPNTIEAKIIRARSLSEMRKVMISNTDARILAGGKVSHYSGKMPGIIEEAKITLEQKKPLFLLGALGGAARQVIDAIAGKGFSFTNNAFHQSEEYNTFKNQYNKNEEGLIDIGADASFFKDFGLQGLSELNGLSREENERLFVTSNLPEMLYFIFKGLKQTCSN
jgi:hypothetical protein